MYEHKKIFGTKLYLNFTNKEFSQNNLIIVNTVKIIKILMCTYCNIMTITAWLTKRHVNIYLIANKLNYCGPNIILDTS